jgi:hypothetical protein
LRQFAVSGKTGGGASWSSMADLIGSGKSSARPPQSRRKPASAESTLSGFLGSLVSETSQSNWQAR